MTKLRQRLELKQKASVEAQLVPAEALSVDSPWLSTAIVKAG